MITTERKLKYLSVYISDFVDAFPKKVKPFDTWLQDKIKKRNNYGKEQANKIIKNKCSYCCRSFEYNYLQKTKDHIVPISMGGLNVPENKASCCHDCNLWKADKLPSVWLREIERLLKSGRNISLPYNIGLLKLMTGRLRTVIKTLDKNKRKVSLYDF